MTVARRRIDVSDGVIAPTFSAISATCVPGRDKRVVAQMLMPAPTGNPPGDAWRPVSGKFDCLES